MNTCNTRFNFENIEDQHIRDAIAKIKTSRALKMITYIAFF